MSDTASHQNAHLSTADPEWVEFSRVAPIPTLVGTAAELRAMIEQGKAMTPIAPPVGLTVSEKEIAVDDDKNNILLRIYTPAEQRASYPLLVYYHGGGWTVGDLDTEDGVCRLLCKGTTSVVVSVNYRKAPENPFPTAVDDSWAALSWVINHTEALKGNPNCVIVGGNSAGANLTTVLTQRARDSKSFKTHGQLLRNPMVCHPDAHPADLDFFSYEQNANAPILPLESVEKFLGFYNPPPNDIRMSSLLAESFAGLPPAYFQISGGDVLRDDGIIYAEKLEQAGVPVKKDTYQGLPHAFFMFPHLKSSQKSENDLVEGLRWMIGLAS